MTTPGGALLVLAIVLPVVGALLAFAAGGRAVERIALATVPPGLALAVAIGVALAASPLHSSSPPWGRRPSWSAASWRSGRSGSSS